MKNLLKNPLTYLFLVVIVISAVALVFYFKGGSDDTVAKVNDVKITKDEFYDTLVSYYGAQTLDSMIADKIVNMEAEKQKIAVTDDEIQAELDKMAESYGGKETFEQQLALSGMTVDNMKSEIKSYLETVKLLEPRIKITDEEISTYFDQNKDDFNEPEQVEASHILVADEATAKEVKQKLNEGGDFASLAAEYSTDTNNAKNGGELGYFERGVMGEAFENAAFSMKVGDISEPVKSQFGYHIIKVTGRKEAKEATLEDSKAEIEETLKNQKINSEYSTWLTEKKGEYEIYNSLVKQ